MREGFTYPRREFLKKAGLAGGAMVMANVAGGIPSAAAAMEEEKGAADELLKGVCDIHIHAAPDVKGRCINEFDFACKAKDLGYRAVMYKSNEWSCHDRAYLIRQALPDFEVFGSFCMNYAVGDKINVHAAKMAVETTGHCCKCIWMPTMAAVYPNAVEGRAGQGIPVVQDGKVLPEVVQVMEICADHDIIFATGHSSPQESLLMAAKAKEVGVHKFVVTHVNSLIWRMTADDIKRCVDLGAYIELCYLPRVWGAGTAMSQYERESARDFMNYVSVAPERSFISTDMGQANMPDPSEGMRACIGELLDGGVSQRVVDTLVRRNPAYLLGLEG